MNKKLMCVLSVLLWEGSNCPFSKTWIQCWQVLCLLGVQKVKDMSAGVVGSDPCSRMLMALQRMGVVTNYERIWEFSVDIVDCIQTLPEGFTRELPSTDQFQKPPSVPTTTAFDGLEELRKQLDSLNSC